MLLDFISPHIQQRIDFLIYSPHSSHELILRPGALTSAFEAGYCYNFTAFGAFHVFIFSKSGP